MADDSEKMRYPPNSPAKKRNPWSPSKTMMQSPSKEEQASCREQPMDPLDCGTALCWRQRTAAQETKNPRARQSVLGEWWYGN